LRTPPVLLAAFATVAVVVFFAVLLTVSFI
jgi:hypothetical protein